MTAQSQPEIVLIEWSGVAALDAASNKRTRLRLHYGTDGLDDMGTDNRAGFVRYSEETNVFYLYPQEDSPPSAAKRINHTKLVRIRFARHAQNHFRLNGYGDLWTHPDYRVQIDVAWRMIEQAEWKFIRDFGQGTFNRLAANRAVRDNLLAIQQRMRDNQL